MKKIKDREEKKGRDRLLLKFDSPLMDEMGVEEDVESKDIVISGNLGIGNKGNPLSGCMF